MTLPARPHPHAGDDGRVRRRHLSDVALVVVGRVAIVVIVGLLLLPVAVVLMLSLSNDTVFAFPPSSWGFRQYRELLDNPQWVAAISYSVKIAIPAVVLSVVVAVPASLAIHRSALPGRGLLQLGGIASIVIPISAFAVAMYGVFAQFGLLGSYWGLVVANTVLAFPFVLIVTSAALTRIPVELELAAMIAGASRPRAWAGVTLRLLLPAILAGALLAFVTSFDEAVFINFLGGPDQVTLPKEVFNSVRYGIDPAITAIAAVLMLTTSAIMTCALVLQRRGR
ncbi:MAG: ABC transporter permease [Actinomycetota bacterium]|nr:ABC transporter permease [Actinomycetota bacterium]